MKLIPRKNQDQSGNQEGGLMPLRDVMNRLFDESLWNPFGLMSKDPFFDSFLSGSRGLNLPSIDFSESDREFTVEADIPGFSAEDLDIELNGNILTIRGKKEEDQEEKDKTYHLRERRESHFERSFPLPSNAVLDNIECDAKDGKLTINIPKSEKDKSRKLKVNVK